MSNLDSFYRFFQIPGMNYCKTGIGAVNFGQAGSAFVSGDPKSNVLLALVYWVEKSMALDTLTDMSDDKTQERTLCRYPQKSVHDGEKFVCQG